MIVVSNSTPLIALSKIDMLFLLKRYFGCINIPEEVYNEVVVEGDPLVGAKEVESADWIETCVVKDDLAVESLSTHLGAGESGAIILSREMDADLLIIDDGDGRKTAESMDIDITGTVGILVHASKQSDIALKKKIDELMDAGFRLSDEVYESIFRL